MGNADEHLPHMDTHCIHQTGYLAGLNIHKREHIAGDTLVVIQRHVGTHTCTCGYMTF